MHGNNEGIVSWAHDKLMVLYCTKRNKKHSTPGAFFHSSISHLDGVGGCFVDFFSRKIKKNINKKEKVDAGVHFEFRVKFLFSF